MKINFIQLFKSWSEAVKKKTAEIPYSIVPHDPQAYLSHTSELKIIKKFLHKYLWLLLFGQINLENKKIPANTRILWLYTGKRNFGDAIMDMSGRALLKSGLKNVKIDLFTLPHLKQLFFYDDIFDAVYDDLNQVKKNKYDFILLSEFNHPSIRLKIKHFKNIRFACMFAYFLGPPRNQTLFSYAAFNDIFSFGLTSSEIISFAKPYLCSPKKGNDTVSRQLIPQDEYLTISVGGIDPNRSYGYWMQFLELIDNDLDKNFPKMVILLGSDNGLVESNKILSKQYQEINITSYVAKISLLQSRELIAHSKRFIGCDGGLMHVAHSTNTPTITLFANSEPYRFFLTEMCRSLPLQSTGQVSRIEPQLILQRLKESLEMFPS
ncbi:MAG: heptosyltransferase [Burkholderiales bacterium]|jgi:ADP-heptose:LPS heptosyltransferase|nr:heptosyltransferase [Burkholderiales bacterium]